MNMRILHVASSYPLYPGDGHAPFMEEMLSALADRGHEVAIVVPRVIGLQEGIREDVQVIGAVYAPRRLQVWGYGRSLALGGRLKASAALVTPAAIGAMALAMRRRIAVKRPDVIHLHWVLPQGVLAAFVPSDIPVVVSVHGADVRFVRGRLGRVARRVLARADAVVSASSGILEAISGVYPSTRSKSHVITHGANTNLFQPVDRSRAKTELGIDPDVPVIVAVGRLVSKKGFDRLIRSMSELTDTGAHLYIIGEGPESTTLRSLASQTNADRIHLLGIQRREVTAKWLAASDVVVIPSVRDGQDVDSGPVVLMEAMASGRPVVTTGIGMAPDVIRHDVNGYLIDAAEPHLLAAAVREALANRTRLGKGARATFEGLGGWHRVASALEEVYGSLIATSRTS